MASSRQFIRYSFVVFSRVHCDALYLNFQFLSIINCLNGKTPSNFFRISTCNFQRVNQISFFNFIQTHSSVQLEEALVIEMSKTARAKVSFSVDATHSLSYTINNT